MQMSYQEYAEMQRYNYSPCKKCPKPNDDIDCDEECQYFEMRKQIKRSRRRHIRFYVKPLIIQKYQIRYEGDMFFKYAQKMLYIGWAVWKKRGIKRIPLSKWKCTNPYEG